MVQGRRSFLDLGHYQPIADEINKLALSATEKTDSDQDDQLHILDCGCGEGYYTEKLSRALTDNSTTRPETDIIGLDISKDAVRLASQRSKQISWIVASGADTPLPNNCLDLMTCLFTPLSPGEFHRLLKPKGALVVASTGPDHLIELRELIYTEVIRNSFDPTRKLSEYFDLAEKTTVRHHFNLCNNHSIKELLAMTPHQWRAPAEAREKLDHLEHLELSIDIQLSVFSPHP
ncbi:methyltransferase domain-containing protein [Motiliproteus sp. MSK22-1]|uniref:methyltransferase domain-containing protein n=1 Tax=Motiliproteus sp. MSK22-1 TaxID=1897630 RepID=UPI00130122D7|nr:methyltransferase domain-containing protein [Motiliproteus sp. MSK22-1]